MIVRAAVAAALVAVTLGGCSSAGAQRRSTTSEHLSVGGLDRTYLVHRPSGLPTHPSLVISLHGGGGTAAGQERLTGYDAVADEHRFVVVYPQGIGKGWADGRGTNQAEQQGVDDVAFISALIDRFVSRDGIDRSRVYVSGFSNGAFMAQRLGCDLSDRIAAIAPVAGTLGVSVPCRPVRPVSVFEIHGTADPIVPYAGGRMTIEAGGPSTIVAAPDMVARWRSFDACPAPAPTVAVDARPDRTSVDESVTTGCRDGSSVAFYSVTGGGHTWPQGTQYLPALVIGRTSQEFSASEATWAFFDTHARTR